METAEGLDVITAFFYFSGFQSIYKQLANKRVRVLVGHYVDPQRVGEILADMRRLGPDVCRLAKYEHSSTSRLESRGLYTDGFVGLFNNSGLYDDVASQAAYRMFESKLKDGSMEIKLYDPSGGGINPQHGKAYIIHGAQSAGAGAKSGSVIVGSSNFTYQGLEGQQELNEVLPDPAKYDEYCSRFDADWRDGVDIQVKDGDTNFLERVQTETWLGQDPPSPHSIYVRILMELFKGEADLEGQVRLPKEISSGKFDDYLYQTEAIHRGISLVNEHRGALIADVVGLGKSVIASAIASNIGLRSVVVAPPHLEEQWKEYGYDFGLRGLRVESSGKIDRLYKTFKGDPHPRLFILDEAHRYRNELTRRYCYLHEMLRQNPDNKVLLLTATPINNTPDDIFALLKLFQIPGSSTLEAGALNYHFRNLSNQYRELQKEIKSSRQSSLFDSNQLDDRIDQQRTAIQSALWSIIEPIMVRRSRLDIDNRPDFKKDLDNQGIKFPKVEGPEIMEYELGNLERLYVETLQRITPIDGGGAGDSSRNFFTGAVYQPTRYIADKKRSEFSRKYGLEPQRGTAEDNLAKFIQRLLATRFESSRNAFKLTIRKIIAKHEDNIEDWHVNGVVEVKLPEGGYGDSDQNYDLADPVDEDDNDLDEDEIYPNKPQKVPKEFFKDEFILKMESDCKILKEIEYDWFGGEDHKYPKPAHDPKLVALGKQIYKIIRQDPNRKIVVFSMYADTVNYLGRMLPLCDNDNQTIMRILTYTSKDKSKRNRENIKRNFDASVDKGDRLDDYDVLIATDAISEGFNLHRAGVVINYDIHYNPTRISQRIGRINRISRQMPFSKIYVYNCFPTEPGEKITRTKEITSFKVAMFNAVIGDDTKKLTKDEQLNTFYRNAYQDIEKDSGRESWDTTHRNYYNRHIKNNESLKEQAWAINNRSRILRLGQECDASIAFAKKGGRIRFAIKEGHKKPEIVGENRAIGYFEATPDEKGFRPDSDMDSVFTVLKSELLEKESQRPELTKPRQVALKLLQHLADKSPSHKDYYKDVVGVIRDHDDLNSHQLEAIKAISRKFKASGDYDRVFSDLVELLSEDYVRSIHAMASSSSGLGEEVIVVTEDLRQ